MASARLHLEDRGRGPILILLHGGSGSWTHWIRNIDALAAGHRVLAVDLPGFGAAPAVDPGLPPEAYLAGVTEAVLALIPPGAEADLAGFSFGATLAASIAAEAGAAVRRLTLVAPGGFGIPAGRRLALRKMPPPDAPAAQVRAAVAHNLGQMMLHRVPPPGDPVVDLQLQNLRRSRFDSRVLSLRQSLAGDLARLGCALQVIWGRHDQLAHPSVEARADLVRAAAPQARIELVAGAGHWVQYEQAAAVNRLLTRFHIA